MNIGWHKLTSVFIGTKYGKEKKTLASVDEHVLKLLSAVRGYIVNNQFNCYRLKDQYLMTSGSNTIISDYDCVIAGKDSYKTLDKMFITFLKNYHNTLPYALDVNIYSGGVYTLVNSNNLLKKNIYTNPSFKNFEDVKLFYIDGSIELIPWAIIKLLENKLIKFSIGSFNEIRKYIDKSNFLLHECGTIYKSAYDKMKEKYSGESFNKHTLDIITKYYLHCYYAKLVNKYMYGSGSVSDKDMTSLRKLMAQVQYFSIESLYTYSSFNVVVLEIQNDIKDLGLKKVDYICSAIENLGDFTHHYITEIEEGRKDRQDRQDKILSILLKYSKYIHRVYYSLGKAYSKSPEGTIMAGKFENKTKLIKEEIVNHRGSKNPETLNFSVMIDMPFDITKFVIEILGHIDKLLTKL
jgi:hypothetical protein